MPLKFCSFYMVPVEFGDGAEKSFYLSAQKLFKHFIVADLMIVNPIVTEFLKLQVRVLDRCHEKLENGHALFEGHERNFGTYSDDFVFQKCFTENIVLKFSLHFSLLVKCELLKLSLLKHCCQYLFSGAFLAVYGPHIVDKIGQKLVHLILISNHQVHISVWQLDSQALPAVKWKVLQVILLKRVEMLPQHPEPT